MGISEGALIGVVATLAAMFIATRILNFFRKKNTTIEKHDEQEHESIYDLQINRIKKDLESLFNERSKYLPNQVDSDRPIHLLNQRIEALRTELIKIEEEKKKRIETT